MPLSMANGCMEGLSSHVLCISHEQLPLAAIGYAASALHRRQKACMGKPSRQLSLFYFSELQGITSPKAQTSSWYGTFCMVREEAPELPQYVTPLSSMKSGSPSSISRA
jgi:hypothetical protein